MAHGPHSSSAMNLWRMHRAGLFVAVRDYFKRSCRNCRARVSAVAIRQSLPANDKLAYHVYTERGK